MVADSVAKYVGESGVCPDQYEKIAKALNDATMRMMYSPDRADFKGLISHACFCVFDCCVYLPPQFETMESVWLNNKSIKMNNMWWEYYPGGDDLKDCCGRPFSFNDLGDGWPFVQDLKGSTSLLIVTTRIEDSDAHVFIKGVDDYGNPVRTIGLNEDTRDYLGEKVYLGDPIIEQTGVKIGSLPKEKLTVKQTSKELYTKNQYSQVTFLKKTKTKGIVFIYQVIGAERILLARLDPNQTVSQFRRFKLVGFNRIKHCSPYVIAKLRKRFIPAEGPDDELLLCHIPALQQMLLSIRYEKSGNAQLAAFHSQAAFAFLNAELNVNNGFSGFRIQYDEQWESLNYIQNLL